MAAELLVVAALSRHAIRQQPVAFPRIPPGLTPRPFPRVRTQSPAENRGKLNSAPWKGLAVRKLVSSKTGVTL